MAISQSEGQMMMELSTQLDNKQLLALTAIRLENLSRIMAKRLGRVV
jgi:hypothetical protein